MQLSFPAQQACSPQTLALTLIAKKKLETADSTLQIVHLPAEEKARAWFSSRVIAYIQTYEGGFIAQDGTAKYTGAIPEVPPFKESFSTLFKDWSHQKHDLLAKPGSEAPPFNFQVCQLFESLSPPCRPGEHPPPERFSSLSLIGRSVLCLPEDTYPWKKAFKKFGLPAELVDLLLLALKQRVKSAPKDIDLRFQIPLEMASSDSNLGASQKTQITEQKVRQLADRIFQSFATRLPPQLPFVLDKECEELLLGQFWVHSQSEGQQRKFLRKAFMEHTYFQAENLKTIYDSDGSVRKMTKILHPKVEMLPPGHSTGPTIPLEIIIAGELKCPQLHHGGLRILLLQDQPLNFSGKDVWTGLFCIALGNWRVVDPSSLDELAWCRLIQAYSEGQSCFQIGEEAVLVEILVQRAINEIRRNRLPEAVPLEEAGQQIAKWFASFYEKHEVNETISFVCLYYNAVRSLRGYKFPVLFPRTEIAPQSLEDLLLFNLARKDISFHLLDSLLQTVAVLCIGLSPRNRCPQIVLDTTDGSYAIRLWMRQKEVERSILLPLDLPQAFAELEKQLKEAPQLTIPLILQFFDFLLTTEREETLDTLPLLTQLGCKASSLEPIVNFLIGREEPSAVYLGLVFAELLKRFDPSLQGFTAVIRKVPELLASWAEAHKKLFIESLRTLLNHTAFDTLIPAPPYPSELLGDLLEAKIYWIKRLIQCGSSQAQAELRFLIADPSLKSQAAEFVDLALKQDPAFALSLLGHFRKQLSDTELWKYIKEIVASLPPTLTLDALCNIQGIAQRFPKIMALVTKDLPSTSAVLMMLRHMDSTKWEKLWALLDQNKLISTEELSEFSLELLEIEMDKSETATKQKHILKYLQNITLLQSLTAESKNKLFSLLKTVGVNCVILEKMAQQCIQNDKKCHLGYILYELVYAWNPQNSRSYLLVERLIVRLAEVTVDQRRKIWASLAAQCDSQFGNFFSGPLPTELQGQTKEELQLAWPSLLMKSSDPQLVAWGLEAWKSQTANNEKSQRIMQSLPMLAEKNFSAGLEAVLILSKGLTGRHLWEAFLPLLRARPQPFTQEISCQNTLSQLIALVAESVDKGTLEELLWLVSQVTDLGIRLSYLSKIQRKQLQDKRFSPLLDSTWLALCKQRASWTVLTEAAKNNLSLKTLSKDQKEKLAILLVVTAPSPMGIQDLKQLISFLNRVKCPVITDTCQSLFQQELPVLLAKNPHIWQELLPFLGDSSRLKLFPIIIEAVSESEPQLNSLLDSFIGSKMDPELGQEKFKQCLFLLLKYRQHLKILAFSRHIEECLAHRPDNLCAETEKFLPQVLQFFEEILPHLQSPKNFWWLWNRLPDPLDQLHTLKSALSNKLLSTDDPLAYEALASLCTKLASEHQTLVWQTVLGAIKMPFQKLSPNTLKAFISAIITHMPQPLAWENIHEAATLLILSTEDNEKALLNAELCKCLETAISLNTSLSSIHTTSTFCMPKLNPQSRQRLLPQLIQGFIQGKTSKHALHWWSEWLAIDWTKQEQANTLCLAHDLIQILKDDHNIDAIIRLVTHPKVAKEWDSSSLLDLFNWMTKRPEFTLSQLNPLVELLFGRLDAYPSFISQLPTLEILFDEPTIQNYIVQCHEDHRVDLMVELSIQQLEQGEPFVCSNLFEKNSNEPWSILALKELLPCIILGGHVITAARLLLLPMSRNAVDPDTLNLCLKKLLELASKYSLQKAVKLLMSYKCLSSAIWNDLWIVLTKKKELELIQKAFRVFEKEKNSNWDTSEIAIQETWINAIGALRCANYSIDLPLSLWQELDSKEGRITLKAELCQDFFYYFIKRASDGSSAEAVRTAFQVYLKAKTSSESLRNLSVNNTVAGLLVSSAIMMNVDALITTALETAQSVFESFSQLPEDNKEEYRHPYRTMLLKISTSTGLVPLVSTESIVAAVRPWAGNGEFLLLMFLLNRYPSKNSQKLALELAQEWLSCAQPEDDWDRHICNHVLADLSEHANLLKLEIPALRKKMEGKITNENRPSLLLLIDRYAKTPGYNCIPAMNWAAMLLLEWVQAGSPGRLKPPLCRELCNHLEKLRPGELGASIYDEILLCRQPNKFMSQEDRDLKISARATDRFRHAASSSRPCKSARLIQWGMENLYAYLGHPEYMELTETFIDFVIAVQDSRILEAAEAEMCAKEIRTILEKIFGNAQKFNKNIVSIFKKEDSKIHKSSDLNLALKISNLLICRSCTSSAIRRECLTIVRQFFLNLALVPRQDLQPHLNTIQPHVTKSIVIFSADISETPDHRVSKLIEFYRSWKDLLDAPHNRILDASLFSKGDSKYGYTALKQACHYINTIESSFGFMRVVDILSKNLDGIILLDQPHAFLEPFMVKLLAIGNLSPEDAIVDLSQNDAVKEEETSRTLTEIMIDLLILYANKSKSADGHFDKGAIPFYLKYFHTLTSNLIRNIQTKYQSVQSSMDLPSILPRLIDCRIVFSKIKNENWKPQIIDTFFPFIEPLLTTVFPGLPLLHVLDSQNRYSDLLKEIISHLEPEEKQRIMPKIIDLLYTIFPQLQTKNIELIKDLFR